MARSDPQVNLRLPAELKAQVEGAASDSGRSLTAEIVHRLETSFELAQSLSETVALVRDAMGQADQWRLLAEQLQQALKERDEQIAATLQTVRGLTQQVQTLGASIERISGKA